MRVRLDKISSFHNNLRTDSIEGLTLQLPIPGYRFSMSAAGLESGIRWVETSPVESVQEDGVFYTQNSTYRITVLDQNPDDLSEV